LHAADDLLGYSALLLHRRRDGGGDLADAADGVGDQLDRVLHRAGCNTSVSAAATHGVALSCGWPSC